MLLISPILSFIDHKFQNSIFNFESDKKQYMPSPFSNGLFAINNESDNGDNNIIVMIERLFFNIRYRFLYKSLTKKAIQKTSEFFMHSVRYITMKY